MSEPPTEMTAYERAARVAYLLVGLRMGLTIREIAYETRLSRRGARYLMEAISRVTPVRQCDDHVWRYCDA